MWSRQTDRQRLSAATMERGTEMVMDIGCQILKGVEGLGVGVVEAESCLIPSVGHLSHFLLSDLRFLPLSS